MGSFAASVALPELLRPWAGAGLELLFLPGGLPCAPAAVLDPAPSPEPASATPAAAPQAAAAPAWPAPWSSLAARVRTPPKVIITYASLADDLAGAADPLWRRQLQSILAYLGWPQGTTLFWPLYFARAAEPGPLFATDIFAQGVRHFGVRHVLCFGDDAADRAALLFPQEGKSSPVAVHRAPAPAELIPLLPHELHRALAHLKALPLA